MTTEIETATNNQMVASGGTGFEDITSDDLQIPLLALIQSNSPERKKKHEKYIPGVEEGMILNRATEQFYTTNDEKTSIFMLPVHIDKATIEWSPRDEGGEGGGFVARHPWDYEPVLQQKAQGLPPNEWRADNGNQLKRTYYLWVIIYDPDEPDNLTDYAIVAFESTKAAVFQNWVTKAKKASEMIDGQRCQVPLWRMFLRLGSKFQHNKKGDFYNFTLAFANIDTLEACGWKEAILTQNDPLVLASEEFRQAITSGKAQADTSSMNETQSDPDDAPF